MPVSTTTPIRAPEVTGNELVTQEPLLQEELDAYPVETPRAASIIGLHIRPVGGHFAPGEMAVAQISQTSQLNVDGDSFGASLEENEDFPDLFGAFVEDGGEYGSYQFISSNPTDA
jgi:hypothetical protein